MQHTPPPPSTFLPSSLPPFRTVSIALLLAPPSQVAGRRKNIYIYLFLRGLRLLPSSPPSLCSFPPFSPQYHPPPPPFEILSVSRTFFFFLIPLTSFSFLLPSTTSYHGWRRASARPTKKERVEKIKKDREG